MAANIYAYGIAGLLLICGMAHILAPGLVERWMTRPGVVRCVGAFLPMLAAPRLLWRDGTSGHCLRA